MSVLPRASRAKRSGALAVIALAFMLLVSACKTEMTLKFTKDGKAHYSAVFEDTDGQLKAQNATCNSVLSLLEQQSSQSGGSAAILKKFNIEDISAGGNLKCKLTQKRAEVSTSLSKEGNGYVLRLAGDPRFSKLSGNKLGGDLTFKIVMPGKITEASGGGQIEGNTVTYTGLSQLANSLVIKSDATGGSGDAPSSDDADSSESPSADSNNADGEESATSDDSSSDENASNDSDSSDSDGFPTWAWYAIGAGVLLLLGIIIFAVRRSKRKNSDTFDAAGPYTGAFGGPQPQQFGGPGQAQFAQPQAPQAPYAPQQFGEPGQPQAPQQFGGPGQAQFAQPQAPQAPYVPQQFGEPGQPQAPQQFAQPQAPYVPQQFGEPGQPQAPQQFAQPQAPYAPQQFGEPQAPQDPRYPQYRDGGHPQNPPQQRGY